MRIWHWIGISVMVLAFTFALIAGVFVPQSTAVNALRDAGYSHIHITGRHWFLVWHCGQGDAVDFTATATNPAGVPVKVHVCAGILKSATIRFG